MIEHGKIISLDDNSATVQLIRTEKCKDCTMCDVSNPKFMQLTVENNLNAQLEDEVVVEISSKSVIGGSFLIFILPLLMMVVGFLATQKIANTTSEGIGIIGALAGFVLTFFALKIYDNSRDTQQIARIKQIL